MKISISFLKKVLILVITLILVAIISQPENQKYLAQTLGLEESTDTFVAVKGTSDQKLEKVEVQDVTDGDTVRLKDGRKVRYLNMDTPESVKQGVVPQCYSKEASEMNKALVGGKTVYILADKQDEDRYGRDLRFLFLSEEDTKDMSKSINAKLVIMGYARSYIIKPNNTYEKQFIEWERQAKNNNLGIWKNCPEPFVK